MSLAYESRGPSFESLVLDRLRKAPPAATAKGIISFQVSGGEDWSLHLMPTHSAFSWGVHPEADSVVRTDGSTMRAILEDTISGVQAFLAGRLTVRGNLALSLRLNGAWEDPARPAHHPVARTVDVDGLSTFYLEAGEGEPVLLLHGLGATNASFLPTLNELARDHRVVVPDLPGFGDTDKPIASLDPSFYSRWLCGLMDALDIESADIVGNSLGGRVAIEMGLSCAGRARRLVLLAPSPAFIKRREFVRFVRFLRPELALIPAPIPRRLVMRTLHTMFSDPARLDDAWYEAAADEFQRIYNGPRGRICFWSAARQIYLEEPHGEAGFWDRLPQLDVPAMFVWGERDKLVPVAFEKHVTRCLPQARSVVVEDCGHVPQYEKPQETHGLIRDFLTP